MAEDTNISEGLEILTMINSRKNSWRMNTGKEPRKIFLGSEEIQKLLVLATEKNLDFDCENQVLGLQIIEVKRESYIFIC